MNWILAKLIAEREKRRSLAFLSRISSGGIQTNTTETKKMGSR